jgi:crotonobetainyl-CoA:carnitine CoA-transferase CaiB-like acyl-CoA transferase
MTQQAGEPPRRRPLDGMRLLDLSHAAAGPVATMGLADLGAEVIKIEMPGRGDGTRYFGRQLHGYSYSDYFAGMNRNKKSLLVDMSRSEGVTLIRRLAARSDIVVQNFRPGVVERLGVGFDDLRAVRPHLVYGSISAYGATGPWAKRPANDIIMQAVSGMMSITGEPDGGPVKVGAPVADYASGLTLMSAVLAALIVRDEHPEGQHVQVAMLDAVVNLMGNFVPGLLAGKYERIERQGSKHTQIVPYQAFEGSDGKYVMVGAFTEGFWHRLCAILGREDLASDPRYETNADRLANQETLLPVLEAAFRTRSRDEWLDILGSGDVPASAIYDLHEAILSDQAQHNGVVQWLVNPDDGEQRAGTVRSPIRSSAWPAERDGYPPPMGRHTREILRSVLQMPDDEVDGLLAGGVVSDKPRSET